ncbi:MAG: RadC family protein [Bacillota bacterium]
MRRHTLKSLPAEERPRERLAAGGAEVLSNTDLLAIILRTGTKESSALVLAERLLSQFGNIRNLAQAGIAELQATAGIGLAKAVQLKAAFELGMRLSRYFEKERYMIGNPRDAAALITSRLSGLDKEHFQVMYLNVKNQVLAQDVVSIGHLHASLVHPRELFKGAIRHSAAGVILAHNHPSGDPKPSPDDLLLTKRLAEAGEIIGIRVLDHIIVGDQKYVSLKEEGLI